MKMQPLDSSKFTIILIKDLGYRITDSGRKIRIAQFQCPKCGKQFVVSIASAYHSQKCKSCAVRENNTKHGLSYERKYFIWYEIIQRCYNTKHAQYKYYGAKGIAIAPEWKNNPRAFIDYINNLENVDITGFSLDRINTKGNYEPNNLRWADSFTQSENSIHGFNGKSKYVGLVLQRNGKWKVVLRSRGKTYHLGAYFNEKEAAQVYDKKVEELGLVYKSKNKDVYPDDFI